MKKFELILKNDTVKLYERFSVFIVVLNIIAGIYFFCSRFGKIPQTTKSYIASALLVTIIVFFLIALFKKGKEFAFVFSVMGFSFYWILMGYWWIDLLLLLFFYLNTAASRQLKVKVSNEIIYPSFPKRIIQWNDLNNLILKDGLLTIDFKNNKIIQQFVKEPDAVNEKEFNDFCSEQLISTTSI